MLSRHKHNPLHYPSFIPRSITLVSFGTALLIEKHMLKTQIQENPLLKVAEVELHYISRVNANDRHKIVSSRQAFEILMQVFDPNKIEHKEFFFVLFLNRANRLLGSMQVSEGGITGTVADIRNIFQGALLANATSIILSHNHPSGNLVPSEADKMLTRKLVDAGNVLDIPVRDHLIVTAFNEYFSFADEGMI